MAATPTRRTQAERLELSARRLLSAAAELIAEKGWDATTAAEIGRRAGYSRAMVHARYGSKDALLDTLFRAEYGDLLDPAEDSTATGLRRVLAPFDRLAELFDEDPVFLETMFVLSFEAVKHGSVLRPRIVAWMQQVADGVERGFTTGVVDGSVRPDVDVAAAVSEVVAAGVGIAYGWIVLPNRFDLATELNRLHTRVHRDYGATSQR
ncbi:TetR/AcrR family transcriptional regulator [Pseudonocardia spinosispora]|uniref:TetR/AcrR family transcriptional regulator n=1 Tax=Pseudonocardia spinosispora TaxID=103441 RepID=UPI0004095864|nr:TetR/AcrR family transcriptional regulator [Pseudonocardia spinosispora]